MKTSINSIKNRFVLLFFLCLFSCFNINAQNIDLELQVNLAYTDVINTGESFFYEITVTNQSNNYATGVKVHTASTGAINEVSYYPSSGTYTTYNNLWNIDSIPPISSTNILIEFNALNQGNYTIYSQVETANETDMDSTPRNYSNFPNEDDSDATSFQVICLESDLSIQMSVSDSIVEPGDTINYTLSITNDGPNDRNHQINSIIELPEDITILNINTSSGLFTTGTYNDSFRLGSIEKNTTEVLELEILVNPTTKNIFEFYAQITGNYGCDPDSNSYNDDGDQSEDDESLIVVDIINTNIDLELELITDEFSAEQVGDSLNFQLQLINLSERNATDIEILHPILTDFTYIINNTTFGNFDSNTGFWNIPNLSNTDTAILDLTLIFSETNPSADIVEFYAEVYDANEIDIDSTPSNGINEEDDWGNKKIATNNELIDLELDLNVTPNNTYDLGIVTYQLTLINNSQYDATDIIIANNIDEWFEILSDSLTVGILDTSNYQWAISFLAANDTAYMEISMKSSESCKVCYTVPFTAEVLTVNEIDIDSTPNNNNYYEDDLGNFVVNFNCYCGGYPPESFDIELDMEVSDNIIGIGDTLEVRINLSINTYLNYMSSPTIVEYIIPNGFDLIDQSVVPLGTYDDLNGTWNAGTYSFTGQFLSLKLVATMPTAGPVQHLAQVIATDDYNYENDSTPNNFQYGWDEDDDDFEFVTVIDYSQYPNRIYARALLEGYHSTGTVTHQISNDAFNLIPLQQPFNISPWNYNGTESVTQIPQNAIDWILLACRDINGNVLEYKAGFIDINGYIIDKDGQYGVEFSNPYNHFSLHHKGHLAVMSNEEYGIGLYDFTDTDFSAYGFEQLKSNSNSFVMYAGDYDNNGLINNLDYNNWINNSAAVNQYLHFDVDGNGIVNNLDYNFWEKNRSKVGALEIQY